MHQPDDRDDAAWAAFDAALREADDAEPPPGLRERCLPGAEWGSGGVGRYGSGSQPDSTGHPHTPTPRHPHTPPVVLVIDDEPSIRRLLQVRLERGGYRVLTARDGDEGLALARSERPDLILLDVLMPGRNGFEVLEALKEEPATGEIPVIMLTARSGDDPMRHGLRAGADLYLAKPFDPEALATIVDRMAAVLGTPENPPPLRRWLK